MPRNLLRCITRRLRSIAVAATVALAALVVLGGLAASPVQASPDNPVADENAFVAALNQTRAQGGLPPLTVDPELRDLARSWSEHQAEQGTISHANPISAGVTSDWLKLGENVGMGGTVSAIMAAFIKSPSHYANIMDPSFTKVGVGVVWSGNTLFTTHRFMKLAADDAPPPPPPPPPPPSTTTTAVAPAPVVAEPAAPDRPEPPAEPVAAPRPARIAQPVAPAAPTTTTTAPPPPPPPPASPARIASVLALLRSVAA